MYIEASVIPVPKENKEAYLEMARNMQPIFHKHGATRIVECWEADVPDGEVTSFPKAVKREEGEALVFSFIEWPSKAIRDEGMGKAMEEMQSGGAFKMPFDGRRMIFGGFEPIMETKG